MKSRLLFLALLLPFFASAQYGYDRHLMNYLQYASLPQTGDIDGDGDVDVIMTLHYEDELLWFENIDGLGRFSTRKVLKTEVDYSATIQLQDYDLDGDLDIVTLFTDQKDIAIFKNDGAGNFASPDFLINDYSPGLKTVRAVDLDSDGDMDLVFGDTDATDFYWLENLSATNEFSDELKLIWDMGPGQIQTYDFGDMDNDGDVDIVAAKVEQTGIPNGPVGKIQFYRNQGNGNFDSLKTVKIVDPPVQAGVSFRGMKIGDINEDGILDIALLSGYDNRLYWYENDFGSWPPTYWDDDVIGIANGGRLFFEDMDNDGDSDFVVARDLGDTECIIYSYNGSPFWDDYVVMDSENHAGIYATVDIDGDGDLDILSGGGGSIVWFKNFGNNLYGGKRIIIPGLLGTTIAQGLDVDQDDKMDVIFASKDGGDEVWYYPGLDGTGKFDEPEKLFESENIVDLHANDMNQDGIADIVYCSKDGNFVAWREGLTTSAHFGTEKIIANNTFTGSPRSVKSPDLNGDGLPDILVASWSDSKISWFRNEGDETFQVTPVVSFEMPWANSVNTADFDNDGDLDILATAKQNGEVVIFENTNGLGSFGQKEVVAIVDEVTSALSADFDNDGNMDILTVGTGDDLILLMRGLSGFNNFAPADTLADFFNGSTKIEIDDVDKDGDLDVLYAGSYQGIGWIENIGNGQFGEYIQFEDNEDIQSISLADLDGDDDLDLIYTSHGVVQLGYYANVAGEPNATIEENLKTKIAKIYPNPFHQSFVLEILEDTAINNCQLQIFTANGQLIAIKKMTQQKVEIENITREGLLFYQLRNLETGEIIESGKLIGF